MDMRIASAAAAYASRLARPGAASKEETAGVSGAATGAQDGGFAGLVKSSISETAKSLNTAEAMSRQALVNPADLGQVVAAVASAEVTLQTVVAVRDRVVAAYQDILRMPI
ncbi:MAG: flagellar hook-basal body complex protein FliE [Alphaproteobacteria bacterium]|nr:flagellar hook-basal body complex protein FliE [Alphaproteobacteria bacterium]